MTLLRHGWRLSAILTAIIIGTGCRWGGNPYARDPLLQNKRAIPTEAERVPAVCAADHPAPPRPPSDGAAVSHEK